MTYYLAYTQRDGKIISDSCRDASCHGFTNGFICIFQLDSRGRCEASGFGYLRKDKVTHTHRWNHGKDTDES